MSETLQQLDAIGARGKIIVSASAGSGKTHVMVKRLSELITKEQKDVRRVLAVTFTNKAAAQMRDRIRKNLLERLKTAEGELRDTLRASLKALPLADISTIHAFCGRLIRTYFYLLGIDPAFRIVGSDDAEGKSLSSRALERTFEVAYEENDGAFMNLLAVYFRKKNDGRLKGMVASLYASARSDPDYREKLEKIAAGQENLFEEAVLLLAEEERRQAKEILRRLGMLRNDVLAASPKIQEFAAALGVTAEQIVRAEDLFAMRALRWGMPRCPARTKNLPPETIDLITRLKSLSETLKGQYDEIGEYHDRDVECERCETAARQAASIAALVIKYDDEFARVKREAGVLDYSDLEHFALQLLGMDEVSQAVRNKYEYVFVDEYQDVNPMQERIISLLAQHDIFLVGDEKQAIYGFRGSRSKFFCEKMEAFKEIGKNLNLSANFRSAGTILAVVNTVFNAALGEKYVPMEGGTLFGDYRGEVLMHNLPQSEKVKQERGVYSVKGATGRRAENAIADRVLAIVEEECGRKMHLGKQVFDTDLTINEGGVSKKGGLRDVKYGDIAVLVRKNTKAAGAIVAALSERGIPVTASAEVNVCDYFEVRLLTDFLEYLDNPAQDIPMASAMLSALGGFSDGELAHIRLHTEKHGLSFRAACADYMESTEKTDPVHAKLLRFYEVTARYRSLARVRTASEMLALLLADGLEAQIAAKGDSANRLARVRRLVAESIGAGSVHAFLKRLSDCEYKVDFSEVGGEDAVHVLTMHASKGLEFSVVILTELDENFRGPNHDDIMWTDDFHIAPRAHDTEQKVYYDTLIRKAAALTARRLELEGERNLLYVGMTRACSRLHLIFDKSGASSLDPADEEFFYAPDDAKRLSDFIPRASLIGHIAPPKEECVFEAESVERVAYRVDEAIVEKIRRAGVPYAHLSSTQVPVKDSATGLMKRVNGGTVSAMRGYRQETEDDATMSEKEDMLADMDATFDAETGTAYHAFLEHVNFGKNAGEELARMKEYGLLTAEQIALLDEERLAAILQISCLQALAGKKLYREQRFLVKLPAREFSEAYDDTDAEDEIIFQGALDLLVEEERGKRYTLIDYKFSSHDDGAIRTHYAVQIKLYKKAIAMITGAREEDISARIVNIARGREIFM